MGKIIASARAAAGAVTGAIWLETGHNFGPSVTLLAVERKED